MSGRRVDGRVALIKAQTDCSRGSLHMAANGIKLEWVCSTIEMDSVKDRDCNQKVSAFRK